MRQWRVGSLSLGLLLIVLGIIMLAGLLGGYTPVEQLLNWWPIILLVLGLEILCCIYLSKQEHPQIKYDLVSIFLIIIIGFLSVGFYTLSTIGILPRVASFVSSSNYTVVLPQSTVELPDQIGTLVIYTPTMPLEIKRGLENKIVLLGKGEFIAPLWEDANDMAAKSGLKTSVVGNTLYVYFEEVPRGGEFNPGARNIYYTLILPEGKQVEIISKYFSLLTLDANVISDNWNIDGLGKIKVNSSDSSNLKITALVSHSQGLRGNLEWVIGETKTGSNVKGTVILGNGENNLNITGSHEVEVYHFEG